jgi:antitoxin (DNA-binding transcriptional repressor) of toxin-antitoxin stability system
MKTSGSSSTERHSSQAGRRPARYAITPEETPRVRAAPASMSSHGRSRVVSATHAARNFSELISRVCYNGETYVVERGGKLMCELVPVEARRCTGADLLALLASLARPAEEFLDAVDAVTRRQTVVEPSAWEK